MRVEKYNGSEWQKVDSLTYVNTSKRYPEYAFGSEENILSVKIRYNKVTSNMAIDDVEITYGKTNKVMVVEDMLVSENNAKISSLNDFDYTVDEYNK